MKGTERRYLDSSLIKRLWGTRVRRLATRQARAPNPGAEQTMRKDITQCVGASLNCITFIDSPLHGLYEYVWFDYLIVNFSSSPSAVLIRFSGAKSATCRSSYLSNCLYPYVSVRLLACLSAHYHCQFVSVFVPVRVVRRGDKRELFCGGNEQ
ncbi:hypothetical protein E2C01_015641 [Portunus trituberculatus]|uniref:Uncharacterized protein n=1 Tax=Portunus trituberculatus TaxID=210409 RepID=A0A5B7DNN1_PORTR|nr:hypothetical protein [Portunus trituberculatus]